MIIIKTGQSWTGFSYEVIEKKMVFDVEIDYKTGENRNGGL